MMKFKNASPLNFAESGDRARMERALKSVREKFGRTYRTIDGAEDELTGKTLVSVNPANPSEVIGEVGLANLEEAERAVEMMVEGSREWKMTAAHIRIQLVDKLADWIEERRDELAAWMIYEVGKTWREADGDVCEAVDFCRYYAREMHRLSEPALTQEVMGEKNYLTYHPRGVGVIIAPWNFPLAILTGMTVATLVTGNTCIIKPAEQSSVIATFLARGLKEVGFPRNSFYFLPGIGEEIGPFLVEHSHVDLITFTGSAEVGFEIIQEGAKRPKKGQRGVKKVIAEMGGKNGLIIDEDADLDEAVMGSIRSAFGYQGQKCSALSRLLVHEKIYDSFVSRFVKATKSLRMGNPANPEYQMGPVIDEEACNRIKKTIFEAKERLGVLYEQTEVPSEGYYVGPTLFEVTSTDEWIFQNEIFGPVVAIKKIGSLEQGVAELNAVRYALTAGIYSRSPQNIEWVKSRIEAGNIYINRSITGSIVQRQPFGGFKWSGVGSKAGGPDYLLQFLEPRTITENTVRRGFAGD